MMEKQTFEIPAINGKTIYGDITPAKNKSHKIALFVHGFKGFKDWGAHNIVAALFADHDINYVKFNFSHSGVVPENFNDVTDMQLFASNTPSKELDDLERVIFYLNSHYPNSEITLIGHSRGGGISILEAARDQRIHQLITWAAIDDFSSLWKKDQEEEWRKNGKIEVYNARTKENMPLNVDLLEDVEQNAEKLNICKAAVKVNIPWLIIHGNQDINVPLEVAKNFHAIQKESKFLEIDGANHVFNARHPYTAKDLPAELLSVCKACTAFIKS